MLADGTGRRSASAAARVRLRWLAIVVALMALLTAGWPLLNSAVADRQRLTGGAKVTIGSQRASSGTVTVGRGWYVQPADSNPALQYILRKGAITVYIRHMSLVDRHEQPGSLWPGMRQVLSVTEPGSTLGAPVSFTTIHGLRAITGPVSGAGLIGTATIFLGPSKEFAIAMLVLAPLDTSRALRVAARQVVVSLMFAEPGR